MKPSRSSVSQKTRTGVSDSVKVTNTSIRFGPLTMQRGSVLPTSDDGRNGDLFILDDTSGDSESLQSGQMPTTVGLYQKVPAQIPLGIVVHKSAAGGFMLTAGDSIDINGMTIEFTGGNLKTLARDIQEQTVGENHSLLAKSIATSARGRDGGLPKIGDILGITIGGELHRVRFDYPLTTARAAKLINQINNDSLIASVVKDVLIISAMGGEPLALSNVDGRPISNIGPFTKSGGAVEITDPSGLHGIFFSNPQGGSAEKFRTTVSNQPPSKTQLGGQWEKVGGKPGTVTADGGTGSGITNTFFVDESGSDISGVGTFEAPFGSIATAVTKAVAGQLVLVYPGTYVETGTIDYTGVSIVGMGSASSVRVFTSNAAIPLFRSGSSDASMLQNMTINGVTRSAAIERDGSNDGRIVNVHFENCLICIKCISGSLNLDGIVLQNEGPIGTAVIVSGNSKVALNDIWAGIGVDMINGVIVDGANAHCHVTNARFETNKTKVGFHVFSGGELTTISSHVYGADVAFQVSARSYLNGHGVIVKDSGSYDLLVNGDGAILNISNFTLDSRKIKIPQETLVDIGSVSYIDSKTKTLTVLGNVQFGLPNHPANFQIGSGYRSAGMIVITTDDTVSKTSEGGNLTDVTHLVRQEHPKGIGFQGTGAKHSILIGVEDNQHWGLSTKMAKPLPDSSAIVMEYWNGSSWEEFPIMCSVAGDNTSRGDNAFTTDVEEHIRYGMSPHTGWQKKVISGHNLHWVRIRNTHNLVFAPEFKTIRYITSGVTVNKSGLFSYNGSFRKRNVVPVTRLWASAGLSNPSLYSNLNLHKKGDCISFNMNLPYGVDTSMPVDVVINYSILDSMPSTKAVIIVGLETIQAQGVIETKPGVVHGAPRGLLETDTFSGNRGLVDTRPVLLPIDDNSRLQTITAANFDVSDIREGDMLFGWLDYSESGSHEKGLVIWSIGLRFTYWKDGI